MARIQSDRNLSRLNSQAQPIGIPRVIILTDTIPEVPITSPLQLLMLPLTIPQQIQSQMMLSTINALSSDGDYRTRETRSDTTTIDPDLMRIRNNITIRRSENIIDEHRPGHVDEAVIRSTSNFSIELSIDDNLLIHETMTDLIDMSSDISSITAINDGTHYRFSISDLTYNKLFLRVFLSGSGTFNIFKKLRRDPNAN